MKLMCWLFSHKEKLDVEKACFYCERCGVYLHYKVIFKIGELKFITLNELR